MTRLPIEESTWHRISVDNLILAEKKIEEGRITFKKPTKIVADGKTKEEDEKDE